MTSVVILDANALKNVVIVGWGETLHPAHAIVGANLVEKLTEAATNWINKIDIQRRHIVFIFIATLWFFCRFVLFIIVIASLSSKAAQALFSIISSEMLRNIGDRR
ncbi:hypothetical protein BGZ80_004219 [Entomortierella chlamydospora]|uniref:Uncharacterized protein n=1 Tax=Entomortierella chlamydospora TaxID=101097 RepID=A0A9P6SW16_9FUNG|nr:hypothetical protein BGZ80_004219 [Entomortierella chlamydospora]